MNSKQLKLLKTTTVVTTYLFIVLMLVLFAGIKAGFLAINRTASLPGVFYVLQPLEDEEALKAVSLGQVVAFEPPENPLYPPKTKFLKMIRGLPGDQVTAVPADSNSNGQMFFINNEPIGLAKPYARLSWEPLQPGPVGTIPENYFFMWTPHDDSYDSRYADIGWIASEKITARAYRIF